MKLFVKSRDPQKTQRSCSLCLSNKATAEVYRAGRTGVVDMSTRRFACEDCLPKGKP